MRPFALQAVWAPVPLALAVSFDIKRRYFPLMQSKPTWSFRERERPDMEDDRDGQRQKWRMSSANNCYAP